MVQADKAYSPKTLRIVFDVMQCRDRFRHADAGSPAVGLKYVTGMRFHIGHSMYGILCGNGSFSSVF